MSESEEKISSEKSKDDSESNKSLSCSLESRKEAEEISEVEEEDSTESGVESSKVSSVREHDEVSLSKMIELVDFSMQASITKSRKELTMSDPGKLMFLLSILHDTCSIGIQMKINKYLEDGTSSKIAFFIYFPHNFPEAVISVLSTRIMDPELRLSGQVKVIRDPMNKEGPVQFTSQSDIEPVLLKRISIVLREDYETGFENMIMIPIIHPIPHEPMFLVGLVNTEEKKDMLHKCHTFVNECFRFCLGSVLNSFIEEEESSLNETNKLVHKLMQDLFYHLDDAEELINRIINEICVILDGEIATLVLTDDKGDLVTKVSNYGPIFDIGAEGGKGVSIPRGWGMSEEIIKSGQVHNCKFVTKDVLFDPLIQAVPGGRIIRCFIVTPLVKSGKTIGLLIVINKVCGPFFNSEDEFKLKSLSPFLAEFIFHSLKFRKKSDLSAKRNMCFKMLLHQPMERTADPVIKDIEATLTCKNPHKYEKFLDPVFDHLTVPEEHTLCIAYKIFFKLGLIRKFEINSQKLIAFLSHVKNSYHHVKVHNWFHGISSLHFTFLLLNNLALAQNICGESGYISLLEALSLLIAALGHDVQYRETVSPFQASTGTSLASLYSSPGAIQQRHSASIIWALLGSEDSNILDNLDKDSYFLIHHLIGKMIIATDLGEFVKNRQHFEEMAERGYKRDKHKELLHSLLMTCSCLNNYAKPWIHCQRIGEATYHDFYTTNTWEEVTKLFDLRDMKPTQMQIPDLQIEFLSEICSPAFKILSLLFPLTEPCYKRVLKNTENWKNTRESLLSEKRGREHSEESSEASF